MQSLTWKDFCEEKHILKPWCVSENGKVPKGTCGSCGQKWCDQELQLVIKREDGTSTLIWIQWSGDKNDIMNREASGTECYKCFDTRRSYYLTISMLELMALRESCPQLNLKFSHDRFGKVNSYKLKQEKTDAKKFVLERTEEDYDDDVRVGMFYSLPDWCAKEYKGVKAKTMDAMRSLIAKNHPELEIVRNKRGVLGVEVFQHGPETYEIRRGRRSSLVQRQVQKMPDIEDLDLAFRKEAQERADKRLDAVVEEAPADEDDVQESTLVLGQDEIEQEAPTSVKQVAKAPASCSSHSGARPHRESRSRSRSRGRVSRRTPASSPQSDRRGPSPPIGKRDGHDEDPKSTKKAKTAKLTPAEKAIKFARESMSMVAFKLTPEKMWTGATRTRDIVNAISTLQSKLHTLTVIHDSDPKAAECMELIDDMTTVAAEVDSRREIIAVFRADVREYPTDISEAHMIVLKGMPVDLVAQMVSHVVEAATDAAIDDCSLAMKAITMLKVDVEHPRRFGLGLLLQMQSGDVDASTKSMSAAQPSHLLCLCDKLFAGKLSIHKMHVFLRDAADAFKLDTAPNSETMTSEAVARRGFTQGFCGQAQCDFSFLVGEASDSHL